MLKNKHRIIIAAIALACTALVSCGSDTAPAESKAETTTTTTSAEKEVVSDTEKADETTTTTTTAEPETSTKLETSTESKAETTESATETIESSATETTESEAPTETFTTPSWDEPLSVEECIKWFIYYKMGEEHEIANIECDEKNDRVIFTFDNGFMVDVTGVVNTYLEGKKTTISQYVGSSSIDYDYSLFFFNS